MVKWQVAVRIPVQQNLIQLNPCMRLEWPGIRGNSHSQFWRETISTQPRTQHQRLVQAVRMIKSVARTNLDQLGTAACKVKV